MKKILVIVISISLLINVVAAASGPNVTPTSIKANLSDPAERLSQLEKMLSDLFSINENLLDLLKEVAALKEREKVLTVQNKELHLRLQVTEVWIVADKERKISLGVALEKLAYKNQRSELDHHPFGEMVGAKGWNTGASSE